MVGVLFSFLICNAIIFSFIFWLLTFIGKLTYSNKYYNYKHTFYECGFKTLSVNKIDYQINFILMALFLIIYDGEFLILLPFALNAEFITFEVYICLIFFFLWLLVALFVDYGFQALEWQLNVKLYIELLYTNLSSQM